MRFIDRIRDSITVLFNGREGLNRYAEMDVPVDESIVVNESRSYQQHLEEEVKYLRSLIDEMRKIKTSVQSHVSELTSEQREQTKPSSGYTPFSTARQRIEARLKENGNKIRAEQVKAELEKEN